jgi:hypothetical protein
MDELVKNKTLANIPTPMRFMRDFPQYVLPMISDTIFRNSQANPLKIAYHTLKNDSIILLIKTKWGDCFEH